MDKIHEQTDPSEGGHQKHPIVERVRIECTDCGGLIDADMAIRRDDKPYCGECQERPIVNQFEKGKEYVRYFCGLILEWRDDNPQGRAKDNPLNNCPGCGAPAFSRFIYNCKGDVPPLENVR